MYELLIYTIYMHIYAAYIETLYIVCTSLPWRVNIFDQQAGQIQSGSLTYPNHSFDFFCVWMWSSGFVAAKDHYVENQLAPERWFGNVAWQIVQSYISMTSQNQQSVNCSSLAVSELVKMFGSTVHVSSYIVSFTHLKHKDLPQLYFPSLWW